MVKQIKRATTLNIREYIGLASDTDTFIAENTELASGSTYRELDGEQRVYQILNGIWYEL